MSDAEDSFVGSVSKSGYLTDGHCMRRQRVTAGRSITASCQEHETKDALESPQKKKGNKSICHDSVCLVCQYGGELFHCDMCLSSYHINCIGLEVTFLPLVFNLVKLFFKHLFVCGSCYSAIYCFLLSGVSLEFKRCLLLKFLVLYVR